jgi:hypothetical protein
MPLLRTSAHWYLGVVVNPQHLWHGEQGTVVYFLDSVFKARANRKAMKTLWTSYLLALSHSIDMPFVEGSTPNLVTFSDVQVRTSIVSLIEFYLMDNGHQVPRQPSESVDCGAYVLRYVEVLLQAGLKDMISALVRWLVLIQFLPESNLRHFEKEDRIVDCSPETLITGQRNSLLSRAAKHVVAGARFPDPFMELVHAAQAKQCVQANTAAQLLEVNWAFVLRNELHVDPRISVTVQRK